MHTQSPDFSITYKEVNGIQVPMWAKSLKNFLLCDKDYSKELKEVLSETEYTKTNNIIKEVINSYITNGEMSGPNNFKIMKVEKELVKNRITYKAYQAYCNNEDVISDLQNMLQSYSSPYWMLLNQQEERAICAAYHACQMVGNGFNQDKEDIFSIAYTFFCLRIRKCYSIYEKALKSANYIEDGLMAAIVGFSNALNDYDFNTPIETGMGPGRLNIPIHKEIEDVLRTTLPFNIASNTIKKVYDYNPDEHGSLTRQELMKEFSACASTVDLMLSKDKYGNIVSSLDDFLEEAENKNSLVYNDNSFLSIELNSVLNAVLNEEEIIIVDYKYNQDLTFEQISEILGYTVRKVKYKLDICKKKLKMAYTC
jgi:DNA-directed RNA polymerase specialized sigma subunit